MADGFHINLDADRAARLKAAAEAAGVTPTEYAIELLDRGLEDDWSEDIAALAEYDRTGESVSAEEALAVFEADVEARLAARK